MVHPQQRERECEHGASKRPSASSPTMLKALLRESHLQNYGMFKRAYQKAARDLDRDLVETYPSEQTFRRWLAGRIKDLPHAEHCAVLESMLPGWTAADLFKPYVAPGEVAGSTLLQELLHRRYIHNYHGFCRAYDIAATTIDKSLVGTYPAERVFHRWISGDIIGLPYPDHCNVLEVMFPGYSARQLFEPAESCKLDSPEDSTNTSSYNVSSASGHLLLPIPPLFDYADLPVMPENDDNIVIPARTHDGKVVLVTVSRRLFFGGLGTAAVGIAAARSGHPLPRMTTSEATPDLDIDPVEHFQQIKKMLMENDNMFGAGSVVLSVQEQISTIQQLRQNCRVADRRQKLLHIQTQFADLCGWLYQDSGDYRAAAYWSGRALEWSHMCCDHEATAFVLARKSQLAADMGDPAEAVDAAEAALKIAPQESSRVMAAALTYEGYGYALRRDRANCEHSYAMAQDLLGRLEADPACPWALFLDRSYVEVQRARGLTFLGEYGAAVESFQKAISSLPRGYRRDCGVYLAREAIAHVGNGDVEQACAVGLQALAIGAETGSSRIIGELEYLDTALRKFSQTSSAADFREAMNGTFPHRRLRATAV